MGAKDKNFYFNLMCEYGYEEIATDSRIVFKGEKAEAESIFPDELLDDLTLVGSKERIKKSLKTGKTVMLLNCLCNTIRYRNYKIYQKLFVNG